MIRLSVNFGLFSEIKWIWCRWHRIFASELMNICAINSVKFLFYAFIFIFDCFYLHYLCVCSFECVYNQTPYNLKSYITPCLYLNNLNHKKQIFFLLLSLCFYLYYNFFQFSTSFCEWFEIRDAGITTIK